MTIEELQQMPIVTVEQVLRFREAAINEIKMLEEKNKYLQEMSELLQVNVKKLNRGKTF